MTVDPERIKWLGRAGENYFRNACNNSGLTPTRPEHDENGWDFFVEMPPNRLPLLNMDAQPAPIKFFCQVKATDDFEDLRKSITVSNFEHLARNPLPSFVLVLDYARTTSSVTVHLCHFDRNRIGQTLKRIRELQVVGKTDLHKHHMTLEAQSEELIDTTETTWLKREVIKRTGHDMGAYVKTKSELLEIIGFDKFRFSINFSTYLKIEDMVDAFLGLRDIDVTDFVVSTSRFGIQLPEESSATGKITIDAQPIGDCYVIVTSKKAKIKSRFPVRAIVPSIPGLDPAHLKIRIQWTFTEFLINSSRVDVKMLFDAKHLGKLSDLTASLEFICASMEADAKIVFFHQSGQFASMQINDRITENFAFRKILGELRTLRDFLDFSGCRDDIELTIQNIYDQEEDIRWMRTAMKKSPTTLSAKFEPPDRMVSLKKNGIFARPIGFDFGNKSFASFCKWDAAIQGRNGVLEAKIRSCEVWNFIFIGLDLNGLFAMHRSFRDHCETEAHGNMIFYNLNEKALEKRLAEKLASKSSGHEVTATTAEFSSTATPSSAGTPEALTPPAEAETPPGRP